MKKQWLATLLICTATINVHAQDKKDVVTPATIIITPEKPLSVKDTSLRNRVAAWCEEQLKMEDYRKIKNQPSADIFPGKVKDGYVFTDKVVKIKHNKISDTLVPIVSKLDYSDQWANIMYSTGLYALPGQYVEITIPASLKDKGIAVQIGCHSDRLNWWVAASENWRRMPIIVKTQELTKATTRVASPFGGLVYITASPRSADWEQDITIKHAIVAPLYKLGETTQQEWEAQLKNNKAPWGELASDNIILTIPDSVLQKVQHPDEVMKLWNLIIEGEMDLAQIPQPFYRAERLVIDEHIGGGFMHSGYPIMVHHSPVKHMLSEDIIANPELLMQPSKGGANWGFFHEIGHDMQNMDWVFGGTTEVSNNLFSLYMFDRLMGGRDNAHGNIASTYTQKAMKKYFHDGVSYAKWQHDAFLGLITFRQLQEGFGWEAFKAFFREYQSMAAKDSSGSYARTEQMKLDLWVTTFSKVTGRNIAPFFEAWGLPVSAEAKKQVDGLKKWMPYNFPPEN